MNTYFSFFFENPTDPSFLIEYEEICITYNVQDFFYYFIGDYLREFKGCRPKNFLGINSQYIVR